MITFNSKEHQEYYKNIDKFIKAVLEFNDYEDSHPIILGFHE